MKILITLAVATSLTMSEESSFPILIHASAQIDGSSTLEMECTKLLKINDTRLAYEAKSDIITEKKNELSLQIHGSQSFGEHSAASTDFEFKF